MNAAHIDARAVALICAMLLCGAATSAVAQTTQIKTEHLMTYLAPLDAPVAVDGSLQIFNVKRGGWVKGPNIQGTFVSPGADWWRTMPSGVFRLDVGAMVRTNDGADIYVSYNGIIQHSKESAERLMKGVVLTLESKIFFDQLDRHYRAHKSVPFERMECWIGSEARKGPLWILKDNYHMLFRKSGLKTSLNEYLFDWTVGSIFHEGIKLKEDAYQLEAYLPSVENIDEEDNADTIEETLAEYLTVIEKANRNLGR